MATGCYSEMSVELVGAPDPPGAKVCWGSSKVGWVGLGPIRSDITVSGPLCYGSIMNRV